MPGRFSLFEPPRTIGQVTLGLGHLAGGVVLPGSEAHAASIVFDFPREAAGFIVFAVQADGAELALEDA